MVEEVKATVMVMMIIVVTIITMKENIKKVMKRDTMKDIMRANLDMRIRWKNQTKAMTGEMNCFNLYLSSRISIA